MITILYVTIYSRGMKFENVSILVEMVAELTDLMRFSW